MLRVYYSAVLHCCSKQLSLIWKRPDGVYHCPSENYFSEIVWPFKAGIGLVPSLVQDASSNIEICVSFRRLWYPERLQTNTKMSTSHSKVRENRVYLLVWYKVKRVVWPARPILRMVDRASLVKYELIRSIGVAKLLSKLPLHSVLRHE